MAGVQDSNELLKTPDAAHITNPGRGYLKVGENEVYELFQSGYAGVPYDPEASQDEVVDERIYKINDLGQYELVYDPGEEVKQGKDTSDLPTQLEKVISEIDKTFEQTKYTLPDKPWLPNLGENIATPKVKTEGKRHLKVPLGLLDIPSDQTQENYDFDFTKHGNTVIFASSGYGKSTVLQTLALNLSKANTPEQVQMNLLDFGNNGLLPLKDLPHVADIVTLEEEEKLQKMLDDIAEMLAIRKKQFKTAGVASLEQYESKTKESLPILVNILDNYDGLSSNDKRKESIDSLLLQVLRDGASLGVYLVFTASRTGAVRMNMMSAISTKMALYLNEESEITTIMGREKVLQEAKVGRGQVMVDVPRAIQFYLPVEGDNSTEILENLEKEVSTLDENWTGVRPAKIPMVPELLTTTQFNTVVAEKEDNKFYIGLNKADSAVESFDLFTGNSIGIFSANKKQLHLLAPFVFKEILRQEKQVILIDALKSLEQFENEVSIYISKEKITNQLDDMKEAISFLIEANDLDKQSIIIFNGLADILSKLGNQQAQFIDIIEQNSDQKQFIFMDYVTNVGNNFAMPTVVTRENVQLILFGGELNAQHFIENLPAAIKTEKVNPNVLHCVRDEELSHIVIPVEKEE